MSDTTQFTGMEGSTPGTNLLKANSMFQERYKIIGVLGGGGMGTVYQARDMHFIDAQRLVAIKEMQTGLDPAIRATTLNTFKREANILATLSHPAIPKIFDIFALNERAYIVMEYVNGSDLELLLQKTKELPIEKVMEWAVELCDVLHYLHNHEPEPIIFRDMKPSNVMIDSRGNVRLIDFGIAKTFHSGIKHTMIGTEGYSAPEQYKGDVSPISDIYSLGASLHHVLTRRDPRLEPPFSFAERPIAQLNPKVPQAFIDVIEKALSFDAKNRYQSCEEMKAAIEHIRRPSIANINTSPSLKGDGQDATGFFDDNAAAAGELQAKWKFKTEDEIRSSPTTYNGVAYVGSYDTNMWAINIETGELVWKIPTQGGIASSPIIDEHNKTVLFGSEDNTFYSLDTRTGRTSWRFETKSRIRGSARLAHEHVFFGSDDGHLYALQAANGRALWSFDTGAPVRCCPWVTNELVIIGSESGEILGIELSGNRKWNYRAKRGILSSPFVDEEGNCFVGSSDNYLYALDGTSGYSLWRFRTGGPIISSPVVHNNLCIFGSADGYVYAVNIHTGKDRWKFHSEKSFVGSPVIHKGALYIGSVDEYLYCLDPDTGKERWKFKTQGAITSAPTITDDLIIIGSMDHHLYALPLVN